MIDGPADGRTVEPEDAERRLAAALRAERLRLYRDGKWSAIVGQSIIGLLVLWVVHGLVPAGAQGVWAAAVLLSLVARAWCDRSRGRKAGAAEPPGTGGAVQAAGRAEAADAANPANPADAANPANGAAAAETAETAELRRTRAAVLGMAVAFGLAGVLLFPAAQFEAQIYLSFMLAGLGAGALTLTSFDLRVALAYALIVMTPLVVRLAASGAPTALGTAVAGMLFVGFLALNGLRAQRNVRLTVAVHEADARRTATLLESQRRLEHATAEMRRASEDLRLTFEHMEQGIFCLGPDGRTSFYNRRMCDLTGLPEPFMATRPTGAEITAYQVAHGHLDDAQRESEEQVRQTMRRARLGEPVPVQRQYFRRTHLGTVLDVKTVPLPGGGFVRTFADVTALFEANQRLALSEAQQRKLALVASHTDDSVIITDADRRIEWTNEAFTRLTGYTLDEVVGRRTAEFLRGPATDPEAAARIDEAVQQRSKAHGEILHYRKDGSSYWFALETRVVHGEDGRVLHHIGIGRDVTARREAEAALHAARDEAERASRAKSDFLSAMSHELRTPMNAILGFAQLLQADAQEPLSARQRERVQLIREAGAHLLGLINDVLDLARVEAGREVIALEAVPLAPLVEECLVLMRPLAAERGIRVTTELPASLPPVLADRLRLKQVLLNLLANAIKYNRPQGRVAVQGGRVGGRVGLTVVDTGPGLDGEAQQRLFTAFERLGAERGPVEGAGIGLALSRRLLALMHGTIEVASEPGRGSRFTVTLPGGESPGLGEGDRAGEGEAATGGAVSTKAVPAEEAGAPPPPAPHATEGAVVPAPGTVLYIEDNAVNLVLMQSMLEPLPGLRLLLAERPEPGLALAQAERPDLVLLDIQLPGIDGYEVLRRLRADARTAAIPVVAISANAMRGDIERGLAAGFDDYLTKPLDVAAVRDLVRRRLAARAAARAAASAAAGAASAGHAAATGA